MTTFLALAAAVTVAVAAPAETNDWENPAVNSINRLPARTYSMPLADEGAAFTDALEPETPFKASLNGQWKFSWTGDPALRVKDFWKADFDDSSWFEIDVPSCVELRGYGTPGYTNTRYPHAKKWPRILDRDFNTPDYNPVSSYRRTFTVPAAWAGREVILRFDGVGSAFYVWVNGRKVGYAEDSKLPSEFDITKFLLPQPTANLIAVEVYRWCDGSFLEDQDMFRYSGIFRDVTLWSRPKDGIWDFAVKTSLENGYRDASLCVEGVGGEWTGTLYDAARQPVARLSDKVSVARVVGVRLWSAEDPYLYTLVLRKGADVRMRRVGFKEQKIVGHTFLVNGRKVKFKGVNRHETNPDDGRTVTVADMVRDITLMKQYNVNTVRTCHYPDHRLWYDLCDRYGIYVVAEANVEGHEPGYGKEGLGLFPEWDHTIVERNVRNAVFQRNNPCVTIWSMGNETGHGDCFRHAIAAVKGIDPTRPVHWEIGNADADVDSAMYPSVEWLEKRGKSGDGPADAKRFDERQTPGKCFFLCEYAHAMGNACGNFKEYWDVFYAHDSLCGGCIWDWIDQAVWKYADRIDPRTGRRDRYLAYGGDWEEAPNDGPFCCNGVIRPDREVTAKLVEIAHVHRNLAVTRTNGVWVLENRFAFTSAGNYAGKWSVVADGEETASGGFEVPDAAPLSRCRFALRELDAAIAAAPAGKELFVNFSFSLKADTLWARRGWVVAREQVAVGRSDAWKFAREPDAPAKVAVAGDEKSVTVTADGVKAVFCRRSGTLCELELAGKTVLKDNLPGFVSGPRLTCLRAFVDNDRGVRDGTNWSVDRSVGGFVSRGLLNLSYHARPIRVEGNRVTTVTEVTGQKSGGFTHEAVWTFGADGSITVANTVTPFGAMPKHLPRLGLSLKLDPTLERMEYYGRGPRENYVDRCSGSFLGRWRSTVTEQFEPYVRPQDNGYKCDVRWVSFADADGRGVRFLASEPMFVQALHYTVEDLEYSRPRAGNGPYRTPLVPVPEVRLNLDVRQRGLGGASCGPWTMDKYVIPIGKTAWTLRIEPLG